MTNQTANQQPRLHNCNAIARRVPLRFFRTRRTKACAPRQLPGHRFAGCFSTLRCDGHGRPSNGPRLFTFSIPTDSFCGLGFLSSLCLSASACARHPQATHDKYKNRKRPNSRRQGQPLLIHLNFRHTAGGLLSLYRALAVFSKIKPMAKAARIGWKMPCAVVEHAHTSSGLCAGFRRQASPGCPWRLSCGDVETDVLLCSLQLAGLWDGQFSTDLGFQGAKN